MFFLIFFKKSAILTLLDPFFGPKYVIILTKLFVLCFLNQHHSIG